MQYSQRGPIPYLETASLPVGGGGGGGGGAAFSQHAEIPSVATAKATKVKYLTIVIRAVYTSLTALIKPVKPSFQMFFKDLKASLRSATIGRNGLALAGPKFC
jgi:hypothetical protein